MKSWKLFSSILLAVSLCGCVRFEPHSLKAGQTAADFQQRNLQNPELKSFLERNTGGAMSQSPPLFDITNLTLVALFYHPDMDVARAKWGVAQAGKNIAAERPNPTLSVAPAYDTTTSIPSPWLVSASLDIPIETAGKRGYRIAQAAHLSQAARLNIASVAWKIRGQVRQRMVELYAARKSETLLKQQQELQSESLRLSQAQFEAGGISAYELTQAKINAENTRFLLRDAERQKAEAQVDLADAIGLSVRALEEIQISFAGIENIPSEIPLKDARQTALLTRSDVLSALAEYAASQSALQLEIAKQYPDIHLSPGYEFDQGDNKWSLGLGVTLPIFNRNQGAIAEAVAKRSEAAATFIAVQAHALSEIDRALAGFQIARQKVTDATGLAEALTKQEKSLRTMLELGEISKSDLIGTQLQLTALNLARLDAIAKAQLAMGAMEDSLQRNGGIKSSAWEQSSRPAQANSNR